MALIDQKRPKIEDVAKKANVSIMSVSRAMRGVEGVSALKREEILRIAREIGYYPNRVAVSLAASSSNLIGVSVPTLFGSVFDEIYDGMRTAFEKAGFATIIDISGYSKHREEEWVERMISWKPAGIVLSGVDHSSAVRNQLSKSRIPVLETWEYTKHPIDLCVGIDHIRSGEMIGRYLAKLGYQKPAYIGVGTNVDVRAERRLEGIRTEFGRVGLKFQNYDRRSNAATFEAGYEATGRLLRRRTQLPDVICYLNDTMAFGGMMHCDKRGLRYPEDIGIVGFNGLSLNNILPKRITTAITPRRKMGELGAQMLVAKILGAKTDRAVSLAVKMDHGGTTKKHFRRQLD